jgi:hypothetical protein
MSAPPVIVLTRSRESGWLTTAGRLAPRTRERRLRSLPIPRSAVLAGRALADTAMVVWSLLITATIGFAVGFRLHGSLPDALAAFGLLVVFGFAFEWLFITLGLLAGGAQAAQGWRCWYSPSHSCPVPMSQSRRCPGGGRALASTSRLP